MVALDQDHQTSHWCVLHTWPFLHMDLWLCDIFSGTPSLLTPFSKWEGDKKKKSLALGVKREVQKALQPGSGMSSVVGLLSLGLENWCVLRTTQLALQSAALAVFQKWIFFILFKFYYISAWSLDYSSVLSSSFLTLEAPSVQAGGPWNAFDFPQWPRRAGSSSSRAALWLGWSDYDWKHLLVPSPVC